MPDQVEFILSSGAFRSTFLSYLDPDYRVILSRFGDLLESALLEFVRGHAGESFKLARAHAVSMDLGMLLGDTQEVVESWSRSAGSGSPALRRAMAETLALLEDAHATLSTAVQEEGATDGA